MPQEIYFQRNYTKRNSVRFWLEWCREEIVIQNHVSDDVLLVYFSDKSTVLNYSGLYYVFMVVI